MPVCSGRCRPGAKLRRGHEAGIGEQADGTLLLLVEHDGCTGLGTHEVADETVIACGGVSLIAALAVDRQAGGGL